MKSIVRKFITIEIELSIQEAEIVIAAFEDARKLRKQVGYESSLSERQLEEVRAMQANLCDMTEEARQL